MNNLDPEVPAATDGEAEPLTYAQIILRVIGLILLGVVLLYLGLGVTLTLVWTAFPWTLIVLVIILFVLFFLGTTARAFRARARVRRLRLIYWIMFGAILVHAGGWKAWRAYEQRLQLPEDVDLEPYRPFTHSTALARLDQPATLQLRENLPRIDGATAFYPLYAAFVEAVYPQGDYPLQDGLARCSKTIKAYEGLVRGAADVIFVLQPSHKQARRAGEGRKELHLTPIGMEAFVFFVNAANPLQDIGSEQIRQIYEGRITNWSEVGGRNEEILAYQRPADSGSQTMLEAFMRGRQLMVAPTERVAGMMGTIINVTAYHNHTNALGYSFLHYATQMAENQGIRILSIDGVAPNAKTISSGAYPFSTDFHAVTYGKPTPQTRELIDWILTPQGQELVRKTGYVPLAESRRLMLLSETNF